jgi:hypothetical protein
MHKNINHGNYYVVVTFRVQEQTNEHLGKILYSIPSPTRLLTEKPRRKNPLFELNYGTQMQDFISSHLLQATQLFAHYTMATLATTFSTTVSPFPISPLVQHLILY